MKTAKEIAIIFYDAINNNYDSIQGLEEILRDFANMHVEAALKVASEKCEADVEWLEEKHKSLIAGQDYEIGIMRNSILKAYPIDNVK